MAKKRMVPTNIKMVSCKIRAVYMSDLKVHIATLLAVEI
jgi:hypothetical protein